MQGEVETIVHAIEKGSAICHFRGGAWPQEWPEGHVHVPADAAPVLLRKVNCKGCREELDRRMEERAKRS